MHSKVQINAVAFQEAGTCAAQGIEYDIVAQADEVKDLLYAFLRAVMENNCITEHLGRAPMAGIGQAPERFKVMYDASQTEMRPTHQREEAEVALRVA